jgi:hypothetical protein
MNFNTRIILTIFITIYFVNKLTKKLLIVQIKNEVETKKKSIEAKKNSQILTEKKNEVENNKKSESKEINDLKKKVNKIIEKQKYEYPDYSGNINQFFLQKTVR